MWDRWNWALNKGMHYFKEHQVDVTLYDIFQWHWSPWYFFAYWKEQNYSFTESDIMVSSRCVPKFTGTAACIMRVDGDRESRFNSGCQ